MSTNDKPNETAQPYSTEQLIQHYGYVLLSPNQTSQKYHVPEELGSEKKLCNGGKGDIDWLHKTHPRHLIFKGLCGRCETKLEQQGVQIDA